MGITRRRCHGDKAPEYPLVAIRSSARPDDSPGGQHLEPTRRRADVLGAALIGDQRALIPRTAKQRQQQLHGIHRRIVVVDATAMIVIRGDLAVLPGPRHDADALLQSLRLIIGLTRHALEMARRMRAVKAAAVLPIAIHPLSGCERSQIGDGVERFPADGVGTLPAVQRAQAREGGLQAIGDLPAIATGASRTDIARFEHRGDEARRRGFARRRKAGISAPYDERIDFSGQRATEARWDPPLLPEGGCRDAGSGCHWAGVRYRKTSAAPALRVGGDARSGRIEDRDRRAAKAPRASARKAQNSASSIAAEIISSTRWLRGMTAGLTRRMAAPRPPGGTVSRARRARHSPSPGVELLGPLEQRSQREVRGRLGKFLHRVRRLAQPPESQREIAFVSMQDFEPGPDQCRVAGSELCNPSLRRKPRSQHFSNSAEKSSTTGPAASTARPGPRRSA